MTVELYLSASDQSPNISGTINEQLRQSKLSLVQWDPEQATGTEIKTFKKKVNFTVDPHLSYVLHNLRKDFDVSKNSLGHNAVPGAVWDMVQLQEQFWT